MIVDDGHSPFIYVARSDFLYSGAKSYLTYEGRLLTNKEYLEHWGKWIHLDERPQLDKLANRLNPYVERKAIPIIKYDRSPPQNLGGTVCAMLVFSDDRQREEVWEILTGMGITLKAWMYDRQTMEMWMPGGVLLENWISEQGFDEEKAEEIREDARHRFAETFGEDDAPCQAWGI